MAPNNLWSSFILVSFAVILFVSIRCQLVDGKIVASPVPLSPGNPASSVGSKGCPTPQAACAKDPAAFVKGLQGMVTLSMAHPKAAELGKTKCKVFVFDDKKLADLGKACTELAPAIIKITQHIVCLGVNGAITPKEKMTEAVNNALGCKKKE